MTRPDPVVLKAVRSTLDDIRKDVSPAILDQNADAIAIAVDEAVKRGKAISDQKFTELLESSLHMTVMLINDPGASNEKLAADSKALAASILKAVRVD